MSEHITALNLVLNVVQPKFSSLLRQVSKILKFANLQNGINKAIFITHLKNLINFYQVKCQNSLRSGKGLNLKLYLKSLL